MGSMHSMHRTRDQGERGDTPVVGNHVYISVTEPIVRHYVASECELRG